MIRTRRIAPGAAVIGLLLLPVACGDDGSSSGGDAITLYTCVSDTTVEPVIDAFEQAAGTEVDLFRAPTGELNARIAGDDRSGGLQADVVWGCDPLTMQGYVDQGLVGGWTPANASDVPARFRTDDYVGVAVLYLLAVHSDDVQPPQEWSDLTGPEYADGVAVPDPAFAASALGAVGYFEAESGYGLDFFADLKGNGAVQVASPDEVATGVAQGTYKAGITIANSAYALQQDGSPIGVVWPRPGAVAIYGPVALATESEGSAPAKEFITYLVSEEGQRLISEAGSYPTLPGVPEPTRPEDAPVVYPDWPAITADQEDLLVGYQQIFGG
ncbi:MAG: extracellular solute-binding protein [Actinomycetota bacterium]|nr:extracellular solute-binding protein [Actinomycetota bacterium]